MKQILTSILNFFTKFIKKYEISWLDYPIILQYGAKHFLIELNIESSGFAKQII